MVHKPEKHESIRLEKGKRKVEHMLLGFLTPLGEERREAACKKTLGKTENSVGATEETFSFAPESSKKN